MRKIVNYAQNYMGAHNRIIPLSLNTMHATIGAAGQALLKTELKVHIKNCM